MQKAHAKIRRIYRLLEAHFGDLGWWPAKSRFEVIVGAILTQNTAWVNVEKAIKALKKEKLMTAAALAAAPSSKIETAIRPAGYFRVKSDRLKTACRFLLDECNGRVAALKNEDADVLREKLLAVKGIGPETADSILLYAVDKPVFVVDSYTRRIFSRHGLVKEDIGYEELRCLVEAVFLGNKRVFNQLHALIVETAKNYCKKKAGLCGECPLGGLK
jgi:endonuclease-3 related protein